MSEQQPDSLPWYKSPVYVTIVVSITTQLVAFFGFSDKLSPETIKEYVLVAFEITGIVVLFVAERARRKSKVQPITLREQKDDPKNLFGTGRAVGSGDGTDGVHNDAERTRPNPGSGE